MAMHETRNDTDEGMTTSAYLTVLHTHHVGMEEAGWERKEMAFKQICVAAADSINLFDFDVCTVHVGGPGPVEDEDELRSLLAPFGRIVQVTSRVKETSKKGKGSWALVSFLGSSSVLDLEKYISNIVAHSADDEHQLNVESGRMQVSDVGQHLNTADSNSILRGMRVTAVKPGDSSKTDKTGKQFIQTYNTAKAKADKALELMLESEIS